ncbi:hypothetical protein Tco_0625658 [Tanacetum coccineum]|uniref:Uncharacterized protein n=1 Tax=Tanacetum coccineum TaxID=301880 RepID=A0ABQ4WHG9_9ASTR
MANKHVNDKIIDVKQEEEEREAQLKSVGVKSPRKDFDDSSLSEEHPNLAECGQRYQMKKVDATIVLTPMGLYYHVNSVDPDAEDDEDDDKGSIQSRDLLDSGLKSGSSLYLATMSSFTLTAY